MITHVNQQPGQERVEAMNHSALEDEGSTFHWFVRKRLTQQCTVTSQNTGILHVQITTDFGISSYENVEIDFDAIKWQQMIQLLE